MMISKDKRIPEEKRDLFKKSLGDNILESELSKLDSKQMLITVGDVVSLVVREHGITPTLSIYDGMTERREMTEFAAFVKSKGLKEVVARNDAGTISAELVSTIKKALKEHIGIICVKGEEDLATMPCILIAPLGSHIIYGWPGVGMKLITTDKYIQREIELLIEQMEELE
jgi:GTP-dependent dephospho-CoA kinase